MAACGSSSAGDGNGDTSASACQANPCAGHLSGALVVEVSSATGSDVCDATVTLTSMPDASTAKSYALVTDPSAVKPCDYHVPNDEFPPDGSYSLVATASGLGSAKTVVSFSSIYDCTRICREGMGPGTVTMTLAQ